METTMKHRNLLYIALVLFVALLISPKANAHVLLKSAEGDCAAVMHVNPDDDPVAGQASSLFFDIQKKDLQIDESGTLLTIAEGDNSTSPESLEVTDTTVSAVHAFPSQGNYSLRLVVTNTSGDSCVLKHTFRVTRGVSNSALDRPTHGWARFLLIVSVCGVLSLGFVAYGCRREILRNSRWPL